MEIQGKIIATGSKGNCVIFDNRIAFDLGVSYKAIEPYVYSLQIVFFTHVSHSDHFTKSTLKRLQYERPSLRIACSEHDKEILTNMGFNNIDALNIGKLYDYGSFKICAIKLYHDCPVIGARLLLNGKKIFYATDTCHLNSIKAIGYDEYYLESNFDEDRVYDVIREKQMNGQYAHQRGSINSHLSVQQAQNFVLRNGTPGKYQFIQLHQSSEF